MITARSLQEAVHEDRWERHQRVLAWRYGVDKALEIIAGFDDRTNADLRKWSFCGSGKLA